MTTENKHNIQSDRLLKGESTTIKKEMKDIQCSVKSKNSQMNNVVFILPNNVDKKMEDDLVKRFGGNYKVITFDKAAELIGIIKNDPVSSEIASFLKKWVEPPGASLPKSSVPDIFTTPK